MTTKITKNLLSKSYRTSFISLYEEHISKEQINRILDSIKSIEKYAFILHNKDMAVDRSEKKKAHFHILIRFKGSIRGLNFIPRLTQVKYSEANAIEKMNDSGIDIETAKSFSNCLLYLIHANDKSKYQYSPDEVIANFDYKDAIKEETENNSIYFVNEVISKFMNGEYNYIDLKDKLTTDEQLKYYSKIEKAKKIRVENNTNITRNIKVYYFVGDSGIGKTTFAKMLLERQYGEKQVFISSSSNDVLDGYGGQRGIIFDDLRGDAFKFHDFIKVIDNHTNSAIKSRFYNKLIEAETIIITSIKSPNELYDSEKIEGEDRVQALRRLNYVWRIKREKENYNFIAVVDWKDENTTSYKYIFNDIDKALKKYIISKEKENANNMNLEHVKKIVKEVENN